MLHVVCYVIDCDVQCNEEEVRSIHTTAYNLIVDIFQGISNRVVRIKMKRMLQCLCVCAASKLQNIYWPACARFSNSSSLDAWIVFPFSKCRKPCTHIPFYGYLMSPFLYLGCSFALSLHICFHCDDREREANIAERRKVQFVRNMIANGKAFSLQPHVCRICVSVYHNHNLQTVCFGVATQPFQRKSLI